MLPSWMPLGVAMLSLFGVVLTVTLQWRSFGKQLRANHAGRLAEMRQAWINDLRSAMSAFHSFGVTPGLDQTTNREFYEAGTKVELLMNPLDPDFDELHSCMYLFLSAETTAEKFAANSAYVAVCQKIIKREWEKLKAELASASR